MPPSIAVIHLTPILPPLPLYSPHLLTCLLSCQQVRMDQLNWLMKVCWSGFSWMDAGTGRLEKFPLLQKLQLPLTYMVFPMLLEAKIMKKSYLRIYGITMWYRRIYSGPRLCHAVILVPLWPGINWKKVMQATTAKYRKRNRFLTLFKWRIRSWMSRSRCRSPEQPT